MYFKNMKNRRKVKGKFLSDPNIYTTKEKKEIVP